MPSSLSRYQVSFYFWLIEPVLKHGKFPKYYDQDCLRIFLPLSKFPIIIQISRKKYSSGSKMLILSKNYQ